MRSGSLHLSLIIILLSITSCAKEFSCETCGAANDTSAQNNRPPVANAGTDTTITLPVSSVVLDGSKSYDPDNNISSFRWVKISGPPPASIDNPNVAKTQVTNLVEGIYRFELKVTDSGGLFDKDTVEITVLAATTPSPPLSSKDTICFGGRPQVSAQLIPFGNLSKPRSQLSVAHAGNKIVFAAGVEYSYGEYFESATVDIYDLVNFSWSTAMLRTPRENPAVAVIGNKIFFAGGGYIFSNYFSTIDIYNTSSNSWSGNFLSVPKTSVAAATVGDKVMFAGGYKFDSDQYPGNIEDLVEMYQESDSKWSTAKLSQARGDISAVTVNQKVYFAGGSNFANGSTVASNIIDIYDDATNSWSTSKLTFLTNANSAIAVGDEIFWTQPGSCDVEIRNVTTGVSRLEHLSRSGAGAMRPVIKDDKVVFLRDGSAYFDIYNTATKEWSIGVLPQPLLFATSVISVDNIIYVAGGVVDCRAIGNGGCAPVPTNQIWRLNF